MGELLPAALVVAVTLLQGGYTAEVETLVAVVAAVQQHYHSGCVFLMEPSAEPAKGLALTQAQKLLHARQVATGVPNISAQGVLPCTCNRPLVALLGGGRGLQQLSPVASGPRWLLLLPEGSLSLDEVFRDVHVPFDCEFLVARRSGPSLVLTEVHRVDRDRPLQTYPWGGWSRGGGLRAPSQGLYRRRTDLQGTDLTAAISPLNAMPGGVPEISDFFPNIWNTLQSLMNFTSRYVMPEDSATGSFTGGAWSGMLGMLYSGEADIAVDWFTITNTRARDFQYSTPLFASRKSVFIRSPTGAQSDWRSLLAPFSSHLWLAVAGAVLLIGAALVAFLLASIELGVREPRLAMRDAALCVGGIFCGQGYSQQPQTDWCRLLLWSANMTAVTLIAAYSAGVVASLTVRRRELPFSTLEELLQSGFHLGVQAKSGLLNDLDNSSSPLLRSIYERLVAPGLASLPTRGPDGFQRICDDPRYAFMKTVEAAWEIEGELTCVVEDLPQTSIHETVALVLRRGSPYRGLLDANLRAMRYAGVLTRLREMTWPRTRVQPEPAVAAVEVMQVGLLLGVLAAGVLLAVGIHVASLLRHRRRAAGDLWCGGGHLLGAGEAAARRPGGGGGHVTGN